MTVRLDEAADDDGADVDPRTDETDDGRVTDRDLQTVVNEVWAAGAEAVAVNGQRLTSLSAIRSAGDADPGRLPAAEPAVRRRGRRRPRRPRDPPSWEGSAGSYLQVLQGYGITLRRGGRGPAGAAGLGGCQPALRRRTGAERRTDRREGRQK